LKIYTKTGDAGLTSLISGRRISKGELRIEAYGTIDELNSHIGLVRDQDVNIVRLSFLKEIQDLLFVIGSNLANDNNNQKIPELAAINIKNIEVEIDNMNAELPDLKHFILPGGHQSVSFGHIARTVCRRAERLVVRVNEIEDIDENIIIFLNRLSDYLFVLCRKMCSELNISEVIWESKK
jgi:cob(I)alamin adenosyltransferase